MIRIKINPARTLQKLVVTFFAYINTKTCISTNYIHTKKSLVFSTQNSHFDNIYKIILKN